MQQKGWAVAYHLLTLLLTSTFRESVSVLTLVLGFSAVIV